MMDKKKIIMCCVALVFVVGLIYFLVRDNKTSEGIRYIQSLENLKVSDVEDEFASIRKEEKNKAIEEGKLDVFGLFDDYVFFGDSRVMGFSTYGFLSDARIFAGSGNTIRDVDTWLNQLSNLSPTNVFMSYGVNDMGLNLNDTEYGSYGALYEAQVKKVLEVVPDAHIYINGIIPASIQTTKENPRWDYVDEYNSQLKEICKKNDWTYIDNSELVNANNEASVYQRDGIHYLSTFYATWAQNIMNYVEE